MLTRAEWTHFVGIGILLTICGRGGSAQTIAPIALLEQCVEMKSDGRIEESISLGMNGARDEAARIGAIELLGRSCDRRAIEPLNGLLGDASPRIRIAVIEALGRLGDPGSVDPLIEQINGASNEVMLALVRTLISFKVHTARNAVVNFITSPNRPVTGEADMRVRGIAILTLNELTNNVYNRKPIGFLFEFQQSKDPAVARIAEETISKLPTTRNGARELVGILKNNHIPMIKVWVCEWIGRLRLSEGRDALTEAAANDRNPAVHEAATNALKLIADRR